MYNRSLSLSLYIYIIFGSPILGLARLQVRLVRGLGLPGLEQVFV